jgi:hypothetical protein
MNKSITVFVGLDVHKDSIEIATADGTADGEVRRVGCVRWMIVITIPNSGDKQACVDDR